jgi:mRNA interferase RelE/StbE
VTDPAGRYALTFQPPALRALRKLDRQITERIKAATEALQDDPRPPGAKMLSGSHRLWRIRIGDDRVVYTIDDQGALSVSRRQATAATSTPADLDMPVTRWR